MGDQCVQVFATTTTNNHVRHLFSQCVSVFECFRFQSFNNNINMFLHRPWHRAEWKLPTELPFIKKCGIDPSVVPFIQHVRAAYVIQLLVSIVSPTSKNLADMFLSLKGNNSTVLLKNLRHLDSCLLSQESMFAGWKKALTNIASGGQFVIRDVLVACKIKPCTPLAEQLIQQRPDGHSPEEHTKGANGVSAVNGESARAAEGDSDAEGHATSDHILLSMTDLITYGFGGKDKLSELPDAHTLAQFQLHLQALVLDHAAEVEKQWRNSLMLLIAKPEEEQSTSARRKSSTTKAELLLRIPDDAQLLRRPNDPNIEMYRLPEKFKLVFFGPIGYLDISKRYGPNTKTRLWLNLSIVIVRSDVVVCKKATI